MNALVKKIYREKTIQKMQKKVNLLGSKADFNLSSFLLLRLLFSVIIFIFTLIINKQGFILAPILTLSFYCLSEYILLDYPIKKRGKKLEKEAIFFFEVLVLTLEGGRNLKHALDLSVDNINSELSDEFKKALDEVKLGKSLNESLEAMKKRIPNDNINNTILNMCEASTYGNSIKDSIYNQIDFLREKQLLDAKATIAKIPTKISIISVIFFIPIMLLIILGPLLIELITK